MIENALDRFPSPYEEIDRSTAYIEMMQKMYDMFPSPYGEIDRSTLQAVLTTIDELMSEFPSPYGEIDRSTRARWHSYNVLHVSVPLRGDR